MHLFLQAPSDSCVQKRGGHISKFKDLSIRDLSQMEYESIARTMQEVWITEEMPPIDVLRKAREEAYIFRGRLPVLLAPTMLTWLTQQSTPQDIDPYVDEDATTVSQSLLKLQLGDAWDESDLLHLTKNLW